MDERKVSRGSRFFDDLKQGALAVSRGGGVEKIAERGNGVAVLANHLADIALPELKLEDDLPLEFQPRLRTISSG